MEEDRYKCVIGMGITQCENNREFSDYGIVYSMLKYDQMVMVQQAFAKHATQITQAMEPLIQDLVLIGIEETKLRTGKDVGPKKA
jgi:hypothetical protein